MATATIGAVDSSAVSSAAGAASADSSEAVDATYSVSVGAGAGAGAISNEGSWRSRTFGTVSVWVETPRAKGPRIDVDGAAGIATVSGCCIFDHISQPPMGTRATANPAAKA